MTNWQVSFVLESYQYIHKLLFTEISFCSPKKNLSKNPWKTLKDYLEKSLIESPEEFREESLKEKNLSKNPMKNLS